MDGGRILNDFKTMCTRILIDFKDDEDPALTIAESESLPDGGPVGRALAQLPRFKNKDWRGATFLPSAKSMLVASWWQRYGRMDGFDEIAIIIVAVRCNSKVPASAESERNWSLFGGTWFYVSRIMYCWKQRLFPLFDRGLLFAVSCLVFICLFVSVSCLPTRRMLSVCCHKYIKHIKQHCPLHINADVMGGRHARLGAGKTQKLVFVRANSKLLANDYTKRPFIVWDPDSVESDGFLGSGEGEDNQDSEDSDFE